MNDRRDVFINTTITKRHIEKSSSSGGSSGGGNSGSSGRTLLRRYIFKNCIRPIVK